MPQLPPLTGNINLGAGGSIGALRNLGRTTDAVSAAFRRFAGEGVQGRDELGRFTTKGLTPAHIALGVLGGSAVAAAAGIAGIAAVARVSARASIDFETAMAGVAKTVDASDAVIERLGQRFIEMSTRIPLSAVELANLGEVAGQLGIETANIEEFVEVAAQLGVSTNLSAEQAAISLARLANITGTSQQDFDRLGSAVVDLGNNFATTEGEILTISQRIASAGAQADLSEGDILGFGAAVASLGIEAEAGGTQVQNLVLTILEAARQGGPELDLIAQTAGMTGAAFRQAFEQDAGGAILSFIEGLSGVQASGGSSAAILEELGISGVRADRVFGALAGRADLLREAMERGNEAFADGTALATEAERAFATTESAIVLLRNAVDAVLIPIGDGLVPGLRDAIEQLTGVAVGAADSSDRLEDFGETIGVLIVQLGNATRAGLEFLGWMVDFLGLADGLGTTADEADRFAQSTAELVENGTVEAIHSQVEILGERLAEASAELDQNRRNLESTRDAGGEYVDNLEAQIAEQEGVVASLQMQIAALVEAAETADSAADATEDLTAAVEDQTGAVDESTEAFENLQAALRDIPRLSGVAADRTREAWEATQRRLSREFEIIRERGADAFEQLTTEIEVDAERAASTLDLVAIATADVGEEAEDTGDSFGDSFRSAAALANDLLGIINQLGIDTGEVGGVIQSTLSGASLGSAAGPIGTVAGAVVGFATSVAGLVFGMSAAEEAARELRAEWALTASDADALREIANALGPEIANIETAFDRISSLFRSGVLTFDDTANAADNMLRILNENGVSIADLQEAARRMGLDVDELSRVLITGSGDTDVAAAQFRVLREALEDLPAPIVEAVNVLDTFLGVFDSLRGTRQALGISTEQELANLVGALSGGILDVSTFDEAGELGTQQGRDQAREFFRALIGQFINLETGQTLTGGALTEDQQRTVDFATRALTLINRLQEQADREAGRGGGATTGGGARLPSGPTRVDSEGAQLLTAALRQFHTERQTALMGIGDGIGITNERLLTLEVMTDLQREHIAVHMMTNAVLAEVRDRIPSAQAIGSAVASAQSGSAAAAGVATGG